MSYSNTTNGLKKPLSDWSQINWRKVIKVVKNLRQRIFLARKLGNFRKLRSLQKLMLRSYANLLLSVRKITQTNKGSLELAQIQIQQWLSSRELELSTEKTLITSMEDGFDFLGFNHRHYNGKLLIKPSKKKVLDFCKRIGKDIKNLHGASQERVIKKLNPILRGFANYYKGAVSKETFSYISYRVWQYLWRWAKRNHPNKPKRWIKNRYFKTIKGNQWTFACTTSNRRGKDKELILYPIAYTPIERHIKVKGEASPDDPSLKEYWLKRHQKYGKSYWEKNSRNYKIAQNQSWKCPICSEPLLNGEEIETHHIVAVAEGGLDDITNLQHLHKACHKQLHSKSKSNPSFLARSKA